MHRQGIRDTASFRMAADHDRMKVRHAKPSENWSWASPARHLLLLVAFLLPPIAMRLAQVFDRQVPLGAPDLRGLLADLTTAALFALATGPLAIWSRLLGAAVALVWTLVCYGNYESIRALGSMLTLDYADYLGDSVFLHGSVLAPAQPVLLAGLVITGIPARRAHAAFSPNPHAGKLKALM